MNNYPHEKIHVQELRIPGERSQQLVGAQNKKRCFEEGGKDISHYLGHPSPQPRQHSTKRGDPQMREGEESEHPLLYGL